MVYNKKTVKGYVADKNIAFQIVTDENIATATDLSTLSDPQFRAAMLEAGFPSSYIGALAQLHQAYPKWSFSDAVLYQANNNGYPDVCRSQAYLYGSRHGYIRQVTYNDIYHGRWSNIYCSASWNRRYQLGFLPC